MGTVSSPSSPAIPPPAATVVAASDDVTGIILIRLVPTGSFTFDDAVADDVESDCGTKTVFEIAAVVWRGAVSRDAVVVEIDVLLSKTKNMFETNANPSLSYTHRYVITQSHTDKWIIYNV